MKIIIDAFKNGKYPSLIAGGLIGAAIGWVIAEVVVYQVFDKKKQNEYIDVEVPVEYDQGTEAEVKEYTAPDRSIMTKSQLERQNLVIKTNYAEKFKEGKLQPIPPKDETMQYIDELDDEGDDEQQGPYVIIEEDWEADTQANKYHWLYYEEDDVLTDDKDRIVPDYEDNIGSEALSSFGESSDDPDVVFIANDDENNMYEIIRIHGSYEALVTGISKAGTKKSSKPRKKKVVPPLEDGDEE